MTAIFRISIYIVLILAVATACNNTDNTYAELDKIDSLLSRNHPDSALIRLHFVDMKSMSPADSAYYGLLNTEARYRLYLPIASDSVISMSLRYYQRDKSDIEKLSRSYYYCAMIKYDLEQKKQAIQYLHQAEKLTRGRKTIDLRHKIYESLAYIYGDNHDIANAMRYSKVALDYSISSGQKDWEAGALDYIANCFMESGQKDSAYHYAKRCMPLVKYMSQEHQAYIFADLGNVFKEEYPATAMELYQRGIKIGMPLHHGNEELLATQFRLQEEELEHEAEIHRMYFILTTVILFFLLILLVIYFRRRRARALHTIQRYQGLIDKYRKDISSLEADGKDNAREVNSLKKKILRLRNEQTDILIAGHELHDSLSNGGTIVKWRKEDFVNYIEFYRLIDNNLITRLEKDYDNLSPKYMLFAILHHNGIPDNEIQRIFAIGASSVRTIKTRIRAKKK